VQHTNRSYSDQFVAPPDLLWVAIPRQEILAEMHVRGDQAALDDLCLAVAVVADAIGLAQSAA
jgi:hypothetical protein